MRVEFREGALIDNVKSWKYWSKEWYDISRGITMALDRAPEDIRVVSAGRGSILMDLPMCGTKLNKVAIARACGFDRNSIYKIQEIQKLLEDQNKQDIKLHGVKVGSPLEILEKFLRSLTESTKDPLLTSSDKPNKRRIALEAGIHRNILYNYDDATKLLDKYLSS